MHNLLYNFTLTTQNFMNEALERLYRRYTGCNPVAMTRLDSAGSNRRYFRIYGAEGEASVIGVQGKCLEENRAFCTIDSHFLVMGLRVPEVMAVDDASLCYIQEDLGDMSLYGAVTQGREKGVYSEEERALLLRAMRELPSIQFRGAQGLDFGVCYPEPSFCARTVMFDLNYFKYCFLKASGLEFDEVYLQSDFDRLVIDLTQDSGDTFMYRDFQSRNVMVRGGQLYYIDFQGGRRGPVYYDVASFVYQARARYPDSLREEMLTSYIEEAAKFDPDIDETRFRERLRLFVLFRMLQVLGAYGFRGYFERKPHFIESVPYAMENLRHLLSRPFESYPYLNDLLVRLSGLSRFNMDAVDKPEDKFMCKQADRTNLQFDGKVNAVDDVVDKVKSENSTEVSNLDQCDPDNLITDKKEKLIIEVFSFSYKKGIPPDLSGNGGGYVFDCRAINNPGRYEYYRQFTGLDREVEAFLEEDGEILEFLDNVYSIVDAHVLRYIERHFTHLQVCFGCTGGQHRSVYSAQHLAAHLVSNFNVEVRVVHRELGITSILHHDI